MSLIGLGGPWGDLGGPCLRSSHRTQSPTPPLTPQPPDPPKTKIPLQNPPVVYVCGVSVSLFGLFWACRSCGIWVLGWSGPMNRKLPIWAPRDGDSRLWRRVPKRVRLSLRGSTISKAPNTRVGNTLWAYFRVRPFFGSLLLA